MRSRREAKESATENKPPNPSQTDGKGETVR